MPFIELGQEFGDAKEAELAPEGKEYDLVCHDVDEHQKDGKVSYRVTIRIEDSEGDYAPFSHFLPLPNPELDQKNDEEKGHKPGTTSNAKMLMLKRFLHAFRVPYTTTGFDPQDIVGATARLPLKQEVYDGRRNQRITLPPLPGEEGSETKEAAPAKPKKKARA